MKKYGRMEAVPRHYMEARGQFHATAALHPGQDTAHMDKRDQKSVVKRNDYTHSGNTSPVVLTVAKVSVGNRYSVDLNPPVNILIY
jgi:hypothetical protein